MNAQDQARLTAYVLGELGPSGRADVEARVRRDPALAAELEALRATAALLRADLAGDAPPALTELQRARVMRGPEAPPRRRSRVPFVVGGLAAAAAALAIAWPRGEAGPTPAGPTPEGAGVAVAGGPHEPPRVGPRVEADPDAPSARVERPPVPAEVAPPPSTRLTSAMLEEILLKPMRTYFATYPEARAYVQVDKPLYRPGETMWIKSWALVPQDTDGQGVAALDRGRVTFQLVDPRGATVAERLAEPVAGRAHHDIDLSPELPGGEYTVRASYADEVVGERKVIVASYQPPRIKKRLELVRKAHGPGDEVLATLELSRPTGEPVAGREVSALVRLDGEELPRVTARTNDAGGALVRFRLPEQIALGDALLTVLVDDGGLTESVSKRVPIVLKKLRVDFYPEGGDLVEGLPGRVYVAGHDSLGEPADLEARIVDDTGALVAQVRTLHDGMGRFAMTPVAGRRYFAEIVAPAGIPDRYPLPHVEAQGCALRTFDDFDGQAPDAVRVAVRCAPRREVIVGAVQGQRFIDAARVFAGPAADTVLHLASADRALMQAQGVARVTVFDDALVPLAERVTFRNRRARLQIEVTPDRPRYGPGDEVELTVVTRDPSGRPVPAELALSVVDDTVVSHADDKQGHILSKLLLEPEIVGEVKDPRYYFDLTEEDSGAALDLLLGTQGYRDFDWRAAISAPRADGGLARKVAKPDVDVVEEDGEIVAAVGGPVVPKEEKKLELRLPEAEPVLALAGPERAEDAAVPMGAAGAALDPFAPDAPAQEPAPDDVGHLGGLLDGDLRDANVGLAGNGRGRRAERERQQQQRVPARVFPIPVARVGEGDATTRSDFRDTVLWAPRLVTDAEGRARVSLRLSDAVTSFRAFAEGMGGGAIGRAETVFASSLPFSMSVKVPAAVTASDALRLPLTLTNETDAERVVKVEADLGALLVSTDATAREVTLAPNASTTIHFGARPGQRTGTSTVRFTATSQGLNDAFTQAVEVVGVGFPAERSASGELAARVVERVDTRGALAGSVDARLTIYPSPVADMLGGLQGLLREPSGCFEQASSSNYPNVMVMRYLLEHGEDDAGLIASTRQLLGRGYQRLAGYETPERGYEWFGGAPGHEALTAYGLVQFRDMEAVFPEVDDDMVERTAEWLLSRRDGDGGFLVNPRALDSFGAASKEVTDAYVRWSLVTSGVVPVDALGPELARAAEVAATTRDAYVLALTADTLLGAPARREAGLAAIERLVALQEADGSFTRADHSITRSQGMNLTIETTALALLALADAGEHVDALDRAAAWLRQSRGGGGSFGTTQATVLALRALTRYADVRRSPRSAGTVRVRIDGRDVGALAYDPSSRGPLVVEDLGRYLEDGEHEVEILHEGVAKMPYTLSVTLRETLPRSSPDARVTLTTAIDRTTVAMGEPVRVTATVRNVTTTGQPMTLARVGIPGGLSFQTWQLKELRDRGIISFYETTPREVVLYFRDLAPGAVKEVPLDLVATVPGEYRASASQAYLYYTNDVRSFTDGVAINVN